MRNTLHQQLPACLKIAAAQSTAVQILQKRIVVSHGDLDHKNVLWDKSGHPIVIDWEFARKLNPTYEELLEGLDWSGITLSFEHGLFKGFLASYVQAGGVIDSTSIQANLEGGTSLSSLRPVIVLYPAIEHVFVAMLVQHSGWFCKK